MRREEMLAYIAGILDGEGSIGLYKHKDNRWQKSRLGFCYQPQIVIINTSKELLKYIEEFLRKELTLTPGMREWNRKGGFVQSRTSKAYKTKPVYELRIRSMWQVRRTLEMVLPYLFLKKRIAELIVEFCKRRENRPSWKAPYTEEEHALYEEAKKLSPRLKQRKW